MASILNTNEIIGTVELAPGEFEVCASADATYNQSANSLVLHLDASLRPRTTKERPIVVEPAWLPKQQTVTEHVAIDEAGDVARDIFKRWVRKIREAAPALRAPSI